MNISENLNRWLQIFNKHRLSAEYLCHFTDQLEHLLFLNMERSHDWDCNLAVSWCQ